MNLRREMFSVGKADLPAQRAIALTSVCTDRLQPL
jgi:hypothetical protein